MNATLFCQRVVLAHALRTGSQHHVERQRLFLMIEHDSVRGFGEVAPQPFALNSDAGFDEVVTAVNAGLQRISEIERREGELPSWRRVTRLFATNASSRMATALFEMALLDRELSRGVASRDELLPRRFDTPSQATVSLLSDEPWEVGSHVQRVRVKVAPGVVSRRALERVEQLDRPVLLDYNCSASNDEEIIDQLRQLARVGHVVAVEQPYDAGNLVDHARLRRRLGVAVSIDEGVRSTRDLDQVLRYESASMICVKPARVGGLANARAIIERAHANGLTAYVGGFFESPFARSVHRVLAQSLVRDPSDLDNVTLAGVDPTSEVNIVEGRFGVEPSAALLRGAQRLIEVINDQS